MRTSFAFVIAITLAAGCLGPKAPSTPTAPELPEGPEPVTLAPIQFNPSVLLGPGAGEPNIAFGANGTVYVTPVNHVYRSLDGGKTFKDLGKTQTKGHGDGDIGVDRTGRLHWLGLGGGIPYQYSDDQGESFSDAYDVSEKTGNDREWLDVTPEGHVFAAWRDDQGYFFAKSKDRGENWEEKEKVGADFLGGPIIHDPSNKTHLYIPYVDGTEVGIAYSFDEGASWKRRVVTQVPASPADLIFTTQIFPVAAIDTAGNIFLVVSMQNGALPSELPKQANRYGVFLFVSTDHGMKWSAPRLLTDPAKVAIMPWIAAGKTGRIVITWYENELGLPNDLLPDRWNVKMLEGLRMHKPAAEQATQIVQVNEGGPSHIGSICSNGLLCVAGGDRSLLDFFEVAISPEGHPGVTWASSIGGAGIGVEGVITNIHARTAIGGTPLL